MSSPSHLPLPLHELSDGTIRVVGTRVPLDTVPQHHLIGESAETGRESFPTVSPVDVYACIKCYYRCRAEVDAYLTRRAAEAAAM